MSETTPLRAAHQAAVQDIIDSLTGLNDAGIFAAAIVVDELRRHVARLPEVALGPEGSRLSHIPYVGLVRACTIIGHDLRVLLDALRAAADS